MKWTKLKLSEDHSLGLSRFEMPWMSSCLTEHGEARLLIKYLGPDKRTVSWHSADDSSRVTYQRHPLKVMEVVVPESASDSNRAKFMKVFEVFLMREFGDRPQDAKSYSRIFEEVVKRSADELASSSG